jgi:hypothetical protein
MQASGYYDKINANETKTSKSPAKNKIFLFKIGIFSEYMAKTKGKA